MKRSGWIKRGKRLKPIGRRGKRMRENGEVFGGICDLVREFPCFLCSAPPPSDPHHVRSRGAGFKDWLPNGDGNVIPLCRRDHELVEKDRQRINDQYGLPAHAKRLGEAYLDLAQLDEPAP